MTIQSINDKIIIIKNTATDGKDILVPNAVESCMIPETFHITPITLEEHENEIVYSIGDQRIVVSKPDISNGTIIIDTEPFSPTVFRKQGGCKPCTNCGRCSW